MTRVGTRRGKLPKATFSKRNTLTNVRKIFRNAPPTILVSFSVVLSTGDEEEEGGDEEEDDNEETDVFIFKMFANRRE